MSERVTKSAKMTQEEWELVFEAMKDRFLSQDGSESFMIAGIFGILQDVISWESPDE